MEKGKERGNCMAMNNNKLMIGVNELIEEIKGNSNYVFKSDNVAFLNIVPQENFERLMLLISYDYWETNTGKEIKKRLIENRSELSNLLTGNNGHTGVKATRIEIADDLLEKDDCFYINEVKERFKEWFNIQIISDDFSIKRLPKVYKYMTMGLEMVKKTQGTRYSSNEEFQYDVEVFRRTLQNLCAMKQFSDFFWWLFMYALFQSEITRFLEYIPITQYKKIMDFMNSNGINKFRFVDKQMVNVDNENFWNIRRKLIETAYGHLIIAGPSLKDAFSVDDSHTIVEELKSSIMNNNISKVSVLITDPIIFDAYANCGDPIRDISGTIESLQERFYDLFEKHRVELHIYFLPLLQIDHAIISEEFMVFRSNKLWNRERKYKGAFGLYLADYYTPELMRCSEYLAHKEYLQTIMENSTIIYPLMDVDYTVLDQLSARSNHMHWRRLLKEKKYKYIYLHKVYEKQIFSYVCDTWSANNESIGQFINNDTILHYNDLFEAENLLNDDTQRCLLPYILETQKLFDCAIRKHDSSINSYCRIFPSLDLGFPNNVQRLAGGFATGMLVTWKCGIDIVPIDATVNVCTSSVFKLNGFDEGLLKNQNELIRKLKELFDIASLEKGYSFSFTSGNHFLIIAKEKDTKDYYLVLHSSANELKNSYMGLYPVEDNWYSNVIKEIQGENGRYFRYLKDEDARHFIRMAHNFKNYNEQIHKWLAEQINRKSFSASEMLIKHHYYMPTDNSIALGTFAEPIGTEVPLFSEPGKNIYIFRIGEDNWQVNLGGSKGNVCVVPHGWGQKIDKIHGIKVNNKTLVLSIEDHNEEIEISSKEHINCLEKTIRSFKDGKTFLSIGNRMLHGEIVKELVPCFEYSQNTEIKGGL